MINNSMVDSAYVFTAISSLLVLSRFVLRRLTSKKFKEDDYVILFAEILHWVYTVILSISQSLGNNHTIRSTEQLQGDDIQRYVVGSQWTLASQPISLSCFWCMKACVLIYLTTLDPKMEEAAAMGLAAVVLGLTWLGSMFAIFLECRPLSLSWQVIPYTPSCAIGVEGIATASSASILTQIFMMAITVPIVYRRHPGFKTKLQMVVMYLFGIMVFISSIMKVVTAVEASNSSRGVWGQLQLFFASLVVNGPVIRDLFDYGYNYFRVRHLRNKIYTLENERRIFRNRPSPPKRKNLVERVRSTTGKPEPPNNSIGERKTAAKPTNKIRFDGGKSWRVNSRGVKARNRLSLAFLKVLDRAGSSLESDKGIRTRVELFMTSEVGKLSLDLETLSDFRLGSGSRAKITAEAFSPHPPPPGTKRPYRTDYFDERQA